MGDQKKIRSFEGYKFSKTKSDFPTAYVCTICKQWDGHEDDKTNELARKEETKRNKNGTDERRAEMRIKNIQKWK